MAATWWPSLRDAAERRLSKQKEKWKDELREIVRSRHGEGVWKRLKAEHLLQAQLLTKRLCRSTRDFDLFAAAEPNFETITEPGNDAGNISKTEDLSSIRTEEEVRGKALFKR
jgi:hypothetical protein